MNFNEHITIIKDSIRMNKSIKQNNSKLINSEKWRKLMQKYIQKMKNKKIYDVNLLDDLHTIVQRIPQQKFIQAILNIQPFRPHFQIRHHRQKVKSNLEFTEQLEETNRTKLQKDSKLQGRISIIKFKQSIHEKINESVNQGKSQNKKMSLFEQIIKLVTEEETLSKQFEAKYHPFKRIIEQFLFLMQSKYKYIISQQENINIEQIQQKLIIDIKLLQEFIVKSSQPYLVIFKSENIEERDLFQIKLIAFIKQYIEKHQKVNLSIRKIMRQASKKTQPIIQITKKLPDFIEVKDFQIKEAYQIQGCFINSMNALMQFSQAATSKQSLKKLKQIRRCLVKDVDEYYSAHGNEGQNRQIDVQTQLEILKFILAKLKTFINEIFAQLRYLQVVFGEHDMSVKYDDSSYMYAQVSIAIEALCIDIS